MSGIIARTAEEVQQEFAEDLGVGKLILWDLYSEDEKNFLCEKLKTLFSDCQINNDLASALLESDMPESKRDVKIQEEFTRVEKINAKIKQQRTDILNILWAQRKYSNGNLLMSTIFVLVAETKSDMPLEDYLKVTKFSCHPVFRVRKCRAKNESYNCCMLFVDENARVYQDWEDYNNNNNLPEGMMIVPKKGVYSLSLNGKVELSVCPTPNSTTTSRALRVIDRSTGFLGLGAAMVPLAALALPVAAPVLAVSAGVCAATGLWSTGRSAAQLADRGNHEQAIDPTDRQARAAWLGIAGGVVGLGACGATYGIVRQAAAGREVSNLAQLAVNGLNVAALLTTGLGVGNGIIEMILKTTVDGEEISTVDLVQLAASLALFTHSAWNFQYASSIVNSTRNGTINDFRSGLSRRQKRIFDKMYKETIRVKGEAQGKVDVIRSLGKIPDNKYFNDIHKINKNLNKNKVRPAFDPDGKVLLNNEKVVDAATLRNNVQRNVGENLLKDVGPIPPSHSGARVNATLVNPMTSFNPDTAFRIIEMITHSIMNARIVNLTDLQNCIFNLCERMSEAAVNKLIMIAEDFLRSYVDDFERRLHMCLPFEQILWRAYEVAADFCREITVEVLGRCAQTIMSIMKQYYEEQIRRSEEGVPTKCKKCSGYFIIAQLS